MFALTTGYGGESTTDNRSAGFSEARAHGPACLRAESSARMDTRWLRPDLRGPIDQPNNVHSQNGLVDLERTNS